MGVIEQRQRMIAAQPHLVTATGESLLVNIAEPKLQRLAVSFSPVQSGSGTPSPSNVRPISGWSNVSAALYRENLFDGVFPTYISVSVTYRSVYVGNGAVTVSSNVPLVNNGGYYANLFALPGSVTSGAATGTNDVHDGQSRTITPVNGYITIANRVWNGVDPTKYPLVISPNPCVIAGTDLGGTYYGGTVDLVSGVMTVTWGNIASYSGQTLTGRWLSSKDAYSAGGTPTTGAQVAYELATPQTVTLTPQTLTALRGQQTVTSPAGAVEISYWTH